jgi:hypothetical protein
LGWGSGASCVCDPGRRDDGSGGQVGIAVRLRDGDPPVELGGRELAEALDLGLHPGAWRAEAGALPQRVADEVGLRRIPATPVILLQALQVLDTVLAKPIDLGPRVRQVERLGEGFAALHLLAAHRLFDQLEPVDVAACVGIVGEAVQLVARQLRQFLDLGLLRRRERLLASEGHVGLLAARALAGLFGGLGAPGLFGGDFVARLGADLFRRLGPALFGG